MSWARFKKLSLKSQIPVLAGVVLVFGLFAVLGLSQQRQETRSRASTQGDLIGDDFAIGGDVFGNVIGNRNRINGKITGGLYGNDNALTGDVGGCINGNNNRVGGNVTGGVVGTNNRIGGSVGSGPCPFPGSETPTPTSAPTPTPTPTPTTTPLATCSDGIDNNKNGLVDGDDPACHTDGDVENPNTYNPNGSEISVSPTVSPTVTVSPTLIPTTTVAPGNTSVKLNLLLHGLGQGGDSANPNSGGNPNPLHPQRTARIEVYNSQNQLLLTKDGPISFNSAAGNFQGQVDLGSSIATGAYTIKVKTEQFLKSLVPGIQNLTAGTQNVLPVTIMINGDINLDNTLNILDYNLLMGCYSDFLPAVSCTSTNKILSDLDDDGAVNQFDYNLFLRELANRTGQ